MNVKKFVEPFELAEEKLTILEDKENDLSACLPAMQEMSQSLAQCRIMLDSGEKRVRAPDQRLVRRGLNLLVKNLEQRAKAAVADLS